MRKTSNIVHICAHTQAYLSPTHEYKMLPYLTCVSPWSSSLVQKPKQKNTNKQKQKNDSKQALNLGQSGAGPLRVIIANSMKPLSYLED